MDRKKFRYNLNYVGLMMLLVSQLVIWQPDVFSHETTSTQQEITQQENAVLPFTLSEYENSTAQALTQAIREGRVTSEQLVQFAYEKIDQENPSLNAVITTRRDAALQEARTLEDTGQPFYGVPLLLKGLGQTLKGESNTNGLSFLADQVAGGTSAYVRALQNAGFVIIGQTNYPQYGWINITDSDMYGVSTNPWNQAHHSGGSSGGAAASVASGMNPIASGSDAGGSIRIPASWTSTIGLKPSRGVIAGNASSVNAQVVHFPITKSMTDTRALFYTMSGQEQVDTTATTVAYTTKSPVGTPVSADAVAAVEEMVTFFRNQGYNVVEVDNPVDGVKIMENYYTLSASTAQALNFSAQQKLKRPLEKDDVELLSWALYQTGRHVTKEQVAEARASIQEEAAKMDAFYAQYPLYLMPTTAEVAPLATDRLLKQEHIDLMNRIEELTPEEQQQLIYDQWLTALTVTPFTQQANLIGNPAISLPTYVSPAGLPLGVQLSAALGNDQLLLNVGQMLEDQHQLKVKYLGSTETEEETNESQSESSETETAATSEDEQTAEDSTEEASTTDESETDETVVVPTETEVHETTEVSETTTETSDVRENVTRETNEQALPQTGSTNHRLWQISGGVIVVIVLTMIYYMNRKRR